MNYSTAIFLVNEQVQGVLCSFSEQGAKDGKFYLFKTFDKTIQKGDYVVVPRDGQNHDMTVVRAEEIGVDPDFDSTIQYKWIVGKIDPAYYQNILATEAQAIETIKSSEKLKRRKELKANLEDLAGEELQQVQFNPDVGNETAKIADAAKSPIDVQDEE